MIIEDEILLERFRRKKRCGWCERPCPNGCDPAHIFSRGAGRVDIPGNLVALCRECHQANHAGEAPRKADLLKIAAKREGCTVKRIIKDVYRIRRTPK